MTQILLSFNCRGCLTTILIINLYAVHLRARAVQPLNKHFLFFVLLPASLPPAKATLQVITPITHVAHTHTPELCYAADENAMEEKACFTTSDPLHGAR